VRNRALDLAGQREPPLSILRLHNFGAYERGTLHRIGGVVVAGAQWRRQKRDRECGIHMPQQRGRMGCESEHSGPPVYLNYTV